jgi:hypothetical protein
MSNAHRSTARTAVERMRELPTGPWRTFKGAGLTENKLADLLSTFGVHSGKVRMVRGKGARQAKAMQG